MKNSSNYTLANSFSYIIGDVFRKLLFYSLPTLLLSFNSNHIGNSVIFSDYVNASYGQNSRNSFCFGATERSAEWKLSKSEPKICPNCPLLPFLPIIMAARVSYTRQKDPLTPHKICQMLRALPTIEEEEAEPGFFRI